MPYSYKIDRDRRLLVLRAWGKLTHAELREARARGAAEPDFHRAFSAVVDAREVTEFERSPGFIRELAERPVLARKSKMAILPPPRQQFGMARLFATFAQLMGRPVQLFASVEKAEAWLGIPLVDVLATGTKGAEAQERVG